MPRILLIDDDPMIRMIVERVLEKEGTQVDTAADGGEGLEKARQHRPDLILCDLDMPVMDGMETLAQLRRDPVLGSVPFVLVTGAASETDEKRMVSCGSIWASPRVDPARTGQAATHPSLREGGGVARGPACVLRQIPSRRVELSLAGQVVAVCRLELPGAPVHDDRDGARILGHEDGNPAPLEARAKRHRGALVRG
jgi:CheY-like chemotaxis protein